MAKKLLLADDSITIQKVIKLTLSESDFDVTCVGNGEMALEGLPEIQPDIVLADVFMPRKSGYEVCEFIKNSPDYRHIPVILLVGTFEPFDKNEAARVKADGHLTKPFETAALVNLVNETLAKAAPASIPPLAATAQVPQAAVRQAAEPPMEPALDEDSLADLFRAPEMSGTASLAETFIGPNPILSSMDAVDDLFAPPVPQAPSGMGFGDSPVEPDADGLHLDLSAPMAPPEKPMVLDEFEVPAEEETEAGEPLPVIEEISLVPPAAPEPQALQEAEEVLELPAFPELAPKAPAMEVQEEGDLDAILTLPELPAPVGIPSEEDILGVFQVIRLDEILRRQKSMEEEIRAEAPAPTTYVLEAEEELVCEPEPAPAVVELPSEVEKEFFEPEVASPAPVVTPAAVPVAAAASAGLDEGLVERIARMVVEQLSEKVVREVVWEVVPDLAELLIRQEMERMKKEGRI